MGADNHTTVEPENVTMDTKRLRLKRSLAELESVGSVRADISARNGVVFESEGSRPGDIPAEVLRVLAEHDAFLPAEQPNDRESTSALIHLHDQPGYGCRN